MRAWSSKVTYDGKEFNVSTVTREYVTAEGRTSGLETLVFKDPTGDVLLQAGGLDDHQKICRKLLSTGELPEDL